MQLSGLAIVAVIACWTTAVIAKDYSNSPYHDWFQKQRTQSGMPCCDVADGQRVDDADWGGPDDEGHYWVRLNSEWKKVPNEALINPKNRPIGYAVVWVYKGQIWCFMAGSGT